MKRIFAVSVLSIMTVVSSNAWAQDVNGQDVFSMGSGANYNIATTGYVQNNFVSGFDNASNRVLTTDTYGDVQFVSAIEQGQVSGLTDALAGKVDNTQIANAAADVEGKMDTMVPTVQRMANAIADAVSTGVGAVDLSSRVAVDQGTEKANQVLVTDADGKVTTATTITQAQVENLSTDLAAKFDAANVIDASEFDNVKPEDLTGKVYGADTVYLKDLLLAGAISGKESIPYDIMHEDGSIVTSLQTPDKHSIIDGINSVYEEVQEKVNVEQGEANKNAIMITDSTGNVIPALVGDCANTTNKCALVTGVDESGNLVLQWEVIARNVVQPTAEE